MLSAIYYGLPEEVYGKLLWRKITLFALFKIDEGTRTDRDRDISLLNIILSGGYDGTKNWND